jgi:hypothetical protein
MSQGGCGNLCTEHPPLKPKHKTGLEWASCVERSEEGEKSKSTFYLDWGDPPLSRAPFHFAGGQPFLFLDITTIEGAPALRFLLTNILYERSTEAVLSCYQLEQLFFTPNVAKPVASLSPMTRS